MADTKKVKAKDSLQDLLETVNLLIKEDEGQEPADKPEENPLGGLDLEAYGDKDAGDSPVPDLDDEMNPKDGDADADDEEEKDPIDADVDDVKEISGNSDIVKKIIDDALKSGKKVRIELTNENKIVTVDHGMVITESKSSVISADEYKELKKKFKKDEKSLSKKELKAIKNYEKAEEENKKKKAKKVNEAFCDLLHVVVDKLDNLETRVNGKIAINSIMEENENMDQLMGPISKMNEDLDKIVAMNKARTNMKMLLENKTDSIKKINKSAIKSSTPVISNISEAAASAIKDITFYTMIEQDRMIAEASESVQKVQKFLQSLLTEDSAMFANADGLETKDIPEPIEAPTFIAKKFGTSQPIPKSQMHDTGDGYDNKSMEVYKLPVSKNIETGKLSVTSAMSSISEALYMTDENGEKVLNIEEANKAFLYQKVSKPKKIEDFSFLIATLEEGKLVAVPKFIEMNAKIFANDNGLSNIYKIPTDRHSVIRSKLAPYMQELGLDIPWED